MEKKNDLVYIVGAGSPWLNNELRYSLRSVDKFLKNYRNVFIFGECPIFINRSSVIHVPHQDTSRDKAVNIKNKLMSVCCHPDVSEDFMFFNDDYFLLKDVDATSYPYLWKCDLDHTLSINRSLYRHHVQSTINVLTENGLPTKNFDTHKPIIYNKQKLWDVIFKYNWEGRAGYTMRSLYCNTLGIEGEYRLDCKFNVPMHDVRLEQKVTGEDCFSIDDRCIGMFLKRFMERTYSEPSRFEREILPVKGTS
jgi:hypothetical protein